MPTLHEQEDFTVKACRDDDDVIARARSGDEAAWAQLYRAHAGRLIVWLHSMPTGDAASAAEDIAADAWLTAAQSMAKFSGTTDDFAGWLFSIARNVAHNRRRTRARRATSPHTTNDPDGIDWGASDDASLTVNGSDLTRRLLAQLSPREAEVIACIDVVGLDAFATSRALGISSSAVRVARHRGLNRLRALLSSPDPPCASAPVLPTSAVPSWPFG